jgi:hypothetical protein
MMYRRLCIVHILPSHHTVYTLINHLRPKSAEYQLLIVSQGTLATNDAKEQARFLPIPF